MYIDSKDQAELNVTHCVSDGFLNGAQEANLPQVFKIWMAVYCRF